ncbi:unnamed protein product, partial [Urochloa humidicola]
VDSQSRRCKGCGFKDERIHPAANAAVPDRRSRGSKCPQPQPAPIRIHGFYLLHQMCSANRTLLQEIM